MIIYIEIKKFSRCRFLEEILLKVNCLNWILPRAYRQRSNKPNFLVVEPTSRSV